MRRAPRWPGLEPAGWKRARCCCGGKVRAIIQPEQLDQLEQLDQAQADQPGDQLADALGPVDALAARSSAPLAIELLQRGTEWSLKGPDRGWQYRWTELSRRTLAQPFYLELASGERVRVEPDDRTLLADDITSSDIVAVGGDSDERLRRRRLELRPGQTAYLSGVLEHGHDPAFAGRGGYRDGGDGLVLRPPQDGPMVASSAPLTREHRQRARFHGGWLLTLLVPLLLVHVGLLGAFNLLSAAGKTVVAEREPAGADRPLRSYRTDGIHVYARLPRRRSLARALRRGAELATDRWLHAPGAALGRLPGGGVLAGHPSDRTAGHGVGEEAGHRGAARADLPDGLSALHLRHPTLVSPATVGRGRSGKAGLRSALS